MRGDLRPSVGTPHIGKAKKRDARRDGLRADGREYMAAHTPDAFSPRDGFSKSETAEILGVDEKRVRILEERASRKFCGRLLRGLIEDPMEHTDPLEIAAEALLDPATAALIGAALAAEGGATR
jgi:hypothetical protein